MKKIIPLIYFIAMFSLGFPVFASAEQYNINVKGELRTQSGEIDLVSSVGAQANQAPVGDSVINRERGSFEIKNINFEDKIHINGSTLDNSVNIFVSNDCSYHSYNIFRRNNQFEISDAYGPQDNVLFTTQSTTIDLGILKEDKPNQVMVDFDIPVSFKAKDTSGEVVAENINFAKFTGMSDSFKPNSTYNLILKDEGGNEWSRSVTTGNYCEGTRVIKRGSYFVTESHPNNSFPPIGFFRNIWLNILGLNMTIIIPLIIAFFTILVTLVLIFRRKNPDNVIP